MDPKPQLADVIADLPAAEGGVNNDNLFEPMQPLPAAAEGGVNNDNLFDSNAAAAEGRGGLYDLDFDQSGAAFSEDMAEICSGKAVAVGFTAGMVNFYTCYGSKFVFGMPYSISILLPKGGRCHYEPGSLLAGILHAIELGYAPGGVNLSCLVDADSIQAAKDIGYGDDVALINHAQASRSGTITTSVRILHLTQCFIARSHSEMCTHLGIPIEQLHLPSVLEKAIKAGEAGLPFKDGWTKHSWGSDNPKFIPPRPVVGRNVYVGAQTAHQLAKTAPQQLVRDTLWSTIELEKSLSGENRTALLKKMSEGMCEMNDSTPVMGWNGLSRILVNGRGLNYFVVKMMIKYWSEFYEGKAIDCPVAAARMFLLFSRREVGETISKETKHQLFSDGIITPASLYHDNDEVNVGQKRLRSSSTTSSRLAYTPTNEEIAKYEDGSADVKEGTVLLAETIDGMWVFLHYGEIVDDEDGHSVVYLHYTDPTHGEEQVTVRGRETKKFVYEYKPLPDDFKLSQTLSYDDMMSYLRKDPKQLDLYIDTNDEGECTNLFIFKGCGVLPTFWEDSQELSEMKEKYERVKRHQEHIDFSELEDELETTPV